jgi:hypothetical protein
VKVEIKIFFFCWGFGILWIFLGLEEIWIFFRFFWTFSGF